MRQVSARVLATATLSLLLASCSFLVDPGSLVIKCEVAPGVQSSDPCGDTMHCVAGVCRACEGAREDCNGVDDDCDGKIDEGFDQDNDGYTWCGGGVLALADCVPTDPTIHPNPLQSVDGSNTGPVAIDVCDGKDNDCDGMIDEAPDCTQTQDCNKQGCMGNLICDTASGHCIAPLPVGSGCKSDAECEGGFCVKPGDFSLGVTLTDNRCATACCVDSDCSSGSVCVAGTSGARACLPTNVVGRGTVKSGEKCANSSECASGLCSRQTCRDLCSNETGCGTDSCIVSSTTNLPQYWTCGRPVGRAAGGGLCTAFDPTACKSGWCLDSNVCARACGKNADCDSGQACVATDVPSLVPANGVTRLGVCKPSDSASATLCCTSADCSGSLCRPNKDGAGWSMTCVSP
jgi:hypothetical protein